MRATWISIALPTMVCAFATLPTTAQQFTDQTATNFPPPSNEYSNQVAIADLDGDGDLDIAFANGAGFGTAAAPQMLRLYINNGAGLFADESAARTGSLTAIARDIEFGDVDGDGDLDIAIAQDFARQPLLLINNGSGIFTNETATRMPTINLGSPHCAFGDVDNDGDLDLVFANGGSSRFGTGLTQLFINNGAGVFTNATATQLPAALVSSPMDVIFGDVDGDLDLDLLVDSRSSSTKLFLNDGAGLFSDATAGAWPGDGSTYSFDFGDIDNDGDLDVLGVNSLSSREGLYVNNGSGLFVEMSAALLPGANNPNFDDNDSKFLDYDNDGDLDFIVARLLGPERIYRNDGASFTLTTAVIQSVSSSSLDIEVGDLDGDGDFDLVTATGESGAFANRIYLNSGPADTMAPTIAQVESLPNTSDTAGPYAIRAAVRDGMTSDHGFFPTDIKLSVTVDGGAPFFVPLRWAGHDVYRGEIPGQASGSVIAYHVVVTDFAGNTNTGSPLSFSINPIGDLNGDGAVNSADLATLLSLWGTAGPTDFNSDGVTNSADLATLLANWTG